MEQKLMEQKSSVVPTCRICLEEDELDNLIMPCNCGGTQSWIHRACLDHWRSMGPSRFHQCEICLFNYEYEEQAVGPCKCRTIRFAACILFDIIVFICFTLSLGASYVSLVYVTGLGGVIGELINRSVWDGTLLTAGILIGYSFVIGVFAYGPRDVASDARKRYIRHKLYAETGNCIVKNLGPSRALEPRPGAVEMIPVLPV